MVKKSALVLLVVVALVVPAAGRWFYFHDGTYRPAPVARPDLRQIRYATPVSAEFVDDYTRVQPGIVLVDRAHDNRFEMAELDVLRSRLSARGLRLEPATTSESLLSGLRHARALVVVSPGSDWTAAEIQAAEAFVEKGGHLLLVADPSRFEVFYPDDYSMSYTLDYDTAHLNDLAARFGLLFGQDYLYNTSDNEGNFRNIRLTEFADHELTRGLEQVVFYAAHSIVSEELLLIRATGETRSSATEQLKEPTVAVLAAQGQVLALGDLTFMTEPYNMAHDNNQLVARIADLLGQARREYRLVDFPSFFDGSVQLVYAGDPLLNDDMIASGSKFQSLLAAQNLDMALVDEAQDNQDTIVLGLYEQAEEIEPYLSAAGVTFVMTPTMSSEAEPAPAARATPKPLTGTVAITGTVAGESKDTAEPEPGRIEVGALGNIAAAGTSLLVFQDDGERQVLLILAYSEEGLDWIVDRLVDGDVDTCLFHEAQAEPRVTVALCPTGEGQADDSGGWEKPPVVPTTEPVPAEEKPGPEEKPGVEPAGKILILALDTGEARYDGPSEAEEYAALLEAAYDVTVWSVASDGTPRTSDVLGYDLIIWAAGDFDDAVGDDERELLLTLMLEGKPLVLSGAYVSESEREAVQRDVQVMDTAHPLGRGLQEGQVIAFETEQEYLVDVLEEYGETGETIVLARGPASEATGAASVVVVDDELSGMRVVVVGFPIYLLPDESRTTLVQNIASWALMP
ncbi:MAG TPA: DUF4350 domain-containing protein [Anaerolineae bacterium]|nr:DUF4350 domain-containing protein [Anaerolineae bacterium]